MPRFLSALARRLFSGSGSNPWTSSRASFDPETTSAPPAPLPDRIKAWTALLSASSRFLSLISTSQQAVRGEMFISMAFVRAQGTSLFVSVYAMLRQLQVLNQVGRDLLEQPFQRIRARLNPVIAATPSLARGELVLPLHRVNAAMSRDVGTKMAFLGEIRTKFPEIRVPDGFVVTAAGYHQFLNHEGLRGEINRRLQAMEIQDVIDLFRISSELQMLIIKSPLPDKLSESILDAYRDLEARAGLRGVRVAVRSSAVGEDSMETSFAGQYRTELNVSEDLLFQAYKEVVASKYATTAISYRLYLGLKDEDLPMCVGCMVMEETLAAGSMYTQDPTSPDTRTLYLDAVHGLNKAVTDGYISPDHWEISKHPDPVVRTETIRNKEKKFACFLSEEGATLVPVPAALRRQPSLTRDQVLALSRLGMTLENHFLCPLDIHWSMSSTETISILQARPLKKVVDRHVAPTSDASDSSEVLARGGQTASPGIAGGTVYVVRATTDMFGFPEGGVLVTSGPNPAWSALLPRAAAVITEQGGGIFGHLANIAREFGIPALFDVPGAVSTLQPGTSVIVDATKQEVRLADHPFQAPAPGHRRGTLLGSPVHQTLLDVLEIAGRPSLVNPLAVRLDPERIGSLLDIALAAHLLAAEEILRLAASPSSLRKVDFSHPPNWWLLSLGGPGHPGPPRIPMNAREHPLVAALCEGLGQHPWKIFTNLPRRNVLGSLFFRLWSQNKHLNVPRPRLFVTTRDHLHLFLSLGPGLFVIQGRSAEARDERVVSLLWQWPGGQRPKQEWLDRFKEVMTGHDFLVHVLDDGLFAWAIGNDAQDVAARLTWLGFVAGHALQWRGGSSIPDTLPTSFEQTP